MSAVEEAWRALREEQRSEPGWHLRRIHLQAPCEIFAGLHQPDGTLGLVVEVEALAVSSTIRMPKSAGFHVDTMLIGHSHTGRVRITLSLAHAAYMTVFAVLCLDTAEYAAAQTDERSALAGFVGRLHVWQAFMAKHGPDGLSETAMIGLMGEIHVLTHHLAPLLGFENALGAWAGPRGEPNDFSFDGRYLEVKATARQVSNSLSISNADQLDIERGRILLAHLRFRASPDGETLTGMVESVRSRLAEDAPAAIPQFKALLLAAGYVDAHRENYVLRLVPDSLQLFEVASDFPRIARNELRAGVLDCSYVIDLGACALWAMPASAIATLVGVAT